MDVELLQAFLEEAAGYMPTIRQGIELYAADASRHEELKTSYRQVHTIKGAALMVGLAEIGAFAKTFQDALDEIVTSKAALTNAQAAVLLNQAETLEEMFAALPLNGAHLSTPDESETKTQFESFSFPAQIEEDISYVENRLHPVTTENNFEIDDEMLEVFAMEAEEHLRNITANLNLLERNPNDREALLEIRRSSHTIKGSAAIIGFQKIAALAHAQEDLLDYLADDESKIDSEAAIAKDVCKILLASTECLADLSSGEDSPELEQKIAEIYAGFTEILKRLKSAKISAADAVAHAETEIQKPIAPAMSQSQPAQQQPDNTGNGTSAKTTTAAEIHQTQVGSSNNSAEQSPQAQQQQPQPRSVTRVSLERLDELVALASEMVISRSAFEQRLSELKRQIEELQNSTRRLDRISGKLETDFAAGPNSNSSSSGNHFSLPGVAEPSVLNFNDENKIFSSLVSGLTDDLIDEFDFLEFDRYTEFHQMTSELTETASDTSAISRELDNLLAGLGTLFDAQRSIFDEMQDKLLRLRMVPLATLTSRFQRTARVTADEEGKLVDFVTENDELEVDSEILHVIVDPLLHLLRNAVAHGIEPVETRRLLGKPDSGQITLRAYNEGTHIVLTVSDDGRGISAAALKEKAVSVGFISQSEAEAMTEEAAFSLIFLPGLSTAAEVSQVSGRGVGMNIVKSSVVRQQGTITVKSEPQKGTSFTLRLPTSLAVTRVLLVKAGGQTFSFPLKIVRRVTEIARKDFDLQATENSSLNLDGKDYELLHFNELLGLPVAPAPEDARILLLLVETFENSYALAIEQILKPEEIVIKPLDNPLKNVPEFLGATILGDGCVVPVLDLILLLQKNRPLRLERKKLKSGGKQTAKIDEQRPKNATLSVLVVDDSPSVRHINSNIVKSAGWQVSIAKDGLEALEMLQAAGAELPDVILTDVEMPCMDGYELLAAIKRREEESLNRIPVVMITSRAGEKHRRKAFDLGASEYLTKPYEDTDLIEKIKQLTRR